MFELKVRRYCYLYTEYQRTYNVPPHHLSNGDVAQW